MIHDPDKLAEIQGHVRKLIRSRMRSLRKAHPLAALAIRSRSIVERVLASLSVQQCALPWDFLAIDSGSSDGSVGLARSLGAEVVELDLSVKNVAGETRVFGTARVRLPLA